MSIEHPLPPTSEMIRQQREHIRVKALHLRTTSEERLRALRGEKKEVSNFEVQNVSELLIDIFSEFRTRRLDEPAKDEPYDFEGERIAWEQMKKELKKDYDPGVFEAAEQMAEKQIALANIS